MAPVCGICGSTMDPDGQRTRAMSAQLIHRGPDDHGLHTDPDVPVTIGARRLSIIDVAGGHQPVSNEDGTVWATLNGEIYNHPALFARLRASGHTLRSTTDTEVLVHLYEEFGSNLVHALEGMYAFSIWDARRRRLILARDRFGEKPLFIRRDEGAIEFASELGPLATAGSRPRMRPDVVDDFFVFGYVPSPRTMIDGIEQLPPAHVLEHDVTTGREQLRRYWRPPRSRATNKEALQELDAETLRLVDQAVRRTLVSDVPLGVLLSGGVDSTLIAAIASGIGPAPLRTFTVGYDLGTVSELATARRTADLLGTHHEELMLTAADVARRVPRLLSVLDQPLADMALVPLHAIAEAARGSVKVVIGGQGADELFGGYPRYRWLQRSTRMHDVVPRKALRLGGRVAVGLRDHRLAHGEVGRVGRLADVLEPMPQLERHLDWVTSYRRHMRPALYGPALTALSSSAGAVASLTHHIAPDMLEQPSVGELMALDQGHWLPDDVLVMADRAGMLASLELRSPYLDRQLAEFAMTIDPSVHLGGGGKRLLRSALAQLAPGELARRRKRAFRTPAAEWLRGPLRQTMTDLVQEGRITRDGWFDRQELQRMMNAHANGIDLSGTLWPVLALGCWLEDAP